MHNFSPQKKNMEDWKLTLWPKSGASIFFSNNFLEKSHYLLLCVIMQTKHRIYRPVNAYDTSCSNKGTVTTE
jgi:hypothetical protein